MATTKTKGKTKSKGPTTKKVPAKKSKAKAKVGIPPAEKAEKLSQSETLKKYREKYTSSKTALGNNSAHCGDDVAAALAALEPDDVVLLAEKLLKIELVAKYEKLNPGQRRMNAGNRIRAAVKRGDIQPEALV